MTERADNLQQRQRWQGMGVKEDVDGGGRRTTAFDVATRSSTLYRLGGELVPSRSRFAVWSVGDRWNRPIWARNPTVVLE